MSHLKTIPKSEWLERMDLFSSGNRGRSAMLIVDGATVVEGHQLRNAEFDPEGKGDDIVITLTDREGNDYFHAVNGPEEISMLHEKTGQVSALEILDKNGMVTMLRLATT